MGAARAAALAGAVGVICGPIAAVRARRRQHPTLALAPRPGPVESTLLLLTAHRPLGFDVRLRLRHRPPRSRRTRHRRRPRIRHGAGHRAARIRPGRVRAGRQRCRRPGAGPGAGARSSSTSRCPPARAPTAWSAPTPGCRWTCAGRRPRWAASTPPCRSSGCPAIRRRWRGRLARVVAERDGVEVGRWEGERLPDVDVLLSSLTSVDTRRRTRGVAARGRRVDHVPRPAKTVLTAVLGLALLATVALLWWPTAAWAAVAALRAGLGRAAAGLGCGGRAGGARRSRWSSGCWPCGPSWPPPPTTTATSRSRPATPS